MRHQPVVEVTRGGIVESLHHGSVAVADSQGGLLADWGDPETVTFLRSSAKPFQALPLLESGAAERFGLTDREIALACASHSGTDEHLQVLAELLTKVGAREGDLGCGTHMPFDAETALRLREAGVDPAPRHHNCSGKHAGMLALSEFLEEPLEDYLEPDHPVQELILETFSAMCGLRPEEVSVGVDGCSAPNFAVPLRAAAAAYARLADPSRLPERRADACRRIAAAMTNHPVLVAGPGRFDTRLMQAVGGRWVSKGGAEGYQAFALPAGTWGDGQGTSACGVAIKIADGNLGRRAGHPVALEVLRQLGAIGPEILSGLEDLAAPRPITNHRGARVGELRTCFDLNWAG